MNRYLKHIGEELLHTVKSLGEDVQTILTKHERTAEENEKIYTKNTGLGTESEKVEKLSPISFLSPYNSLEF